MSSKRSFAERSCGFAMFVYWCMRRKCEAYAGSFVLFAGNIFLTVTHIRDAARIRVQFDRDDQPYAGGVMHMASSTPSSTLHGPNVQDPFMRSMRSSPKPVFFVAASCLLFASMADRDPPFLFLGLLEIPADELSTGFGLESVLDKAKSSLLFGSSFSIRFLDPFSFSSRDTGGSM